MSYSRDNPGYVDPVYLQTIVQLVQPVKQRSYAWMHLHAGARVLDVGCGPATDTIPLAHLVGPTGQVIGVDYDQEMVDAANQKAAQAGVMAWVRHEWAEATALPFAANTFAATRSERVFQHVTQPEEVFREMTRVTKSGGWLVVADTDHSSLSIDCPASELVDVEWRLRRYHTERFRNGYAGRQLYRLCKTQPLIDLRVEAFSLYLTSYPVWRYLAMMEVTEQQALARGVVSAEEVRQWRDSLAQVETEGVFFGYITMLLVAGRKP